MSQQKLLGNVYLEYGQLKNDVTAINNQLASVGKGVNLNFEDKFNKELQKFTNSATAEIKKMMQNISGGSEQKTSFKDLETSIANVKQTIKSIDAKGNIRRITTGFDDAGRSIRETVDSLGRVSKTIKETGDYAKSLKEANDIYTEQSALLKKIYSLKTSLVKLDFNTEEARLIKERISALENERRLLDDKKSTLNSLAREQSNLNKLEKEEKDLQYKLSMSTQKANQEAQEAAKKAAQNKLNAPDQLKETANLQKSVTDAYRKYNSAVKEGDDKAKEHWSRRIDQYRDELLRLQESLKNTAMSSSAARKIEDDISSIISKFRQYDKIAGKSLAVIGNNGLGSYGTFVDKNELAFVEKSLSTIGVHINQARAEQQRFTAEIQNSAAASEILANRIVTFFTSMVLMRGLRTMWRDAIDYVSTYYDQMNQVRIVSGMTEKEATELGKSYRQTAKDMKVSSTEIAKAAVEYWRQGLDENEVNKRLESTIRYSKIANLAFADSAELMTAATNTFEVEAQKVADVWAVLGDESAAGADEIGIAMQKASASASEFGLSFEWLSAYIATISEQTRETPEAIGTSLNALMGRLHSIKQKGYNEEDATKINDVAKALDAVGVALLDSEGNWRDMNLIFDDIAAKWNTMTDLQRSYIATTLAGTRQQNRFLTLMNDMAKGIEGGSRAYELYGKAVESAGKAEEKYAIWVETVEGAHNRMKTSFEDLYSLIEAGWIKNFYNTTADIVDGVKRVADVLGGWTLVIPVVTGLVVGLTTSAGSLAGAIGILRGAFALLAKNPIVVGISAAVLAMSALVDVVKQFDNVFNWDELEERYSSHASTLGDLVSEYDALAEKESLTTAEEERKAAIIKELESSTYGWQSSVDAANKSLDEEQAVVAAARGELEEYNNTLKLIQQNKALLALSSVPDDTRNTFDKYNNVRQYMSGANGYLSLNELLSQSASASFNGDGVLDWDLFGATIFNEILDQQAKHWENQDAQLYYKGMGDFISEIWNGYAEIGKKLGKDSDFLITQINTEVDLQETEMGTAMSAIYSNLDILLNADQDYSDMPSPIKDLFNSMLSTMRDDLASSATDIDQLMIDLQKKQSSLLALFSDDAIKSIGENIEEYYSLIDQARNGEIEEEEFAKAINETTNAIWSYTGQMLQSDVPKPVKNMISNLVNALNYELMSYSKAKTSEKTTADQIADSIVAAVEESKKRVDEAFESGQLESAQENGFVSELEKLKSALTEGGAAKFLETWITIPASIREAMAESNPEIDKMVVDMNALAVSGGEVEEGTMSAGQAIIALGDAIESGGDKATRFKELLEDTTEAAAEMMEQVEFDKLMEGTDANYYEGLRDQLIKAAEESEEAFVELWNKLDDSTKSGLMSVFGNVFEQVITAINTGGDALSGLKAEWWNEAFLAGLQDTKDTATSVTEEMLKLAEAEELAATGYAKWLGMLDGMSGAQIDVQLKSWAIESPDQFKEFIELYPRFAEVMNEISFGDKRTSAYAEVILDAQLAGLDAVIATTKEKQLQLELDKQLANAESEAYKPVLELLQMSMQKGNAFTKKGGIAGFIEAFGMLSDAHVEGLLTTYGKDFIALVDNMRLGNIEAEAAMAELTQMMNGANVPGENAFEVLSKSALKMAEDFGVARDAMNQQTESGYLNYESYKALIEANKDYVDAVVYNNGRLMLSTEKLKAIEDDKYQKTKENIDAEIKALEQRIAVEGEVPELVDQLNSYRAISGEIANMTSAYYKYLMAIDSTNLGDIFDQTSAMVDLLEAAIENGRMYTDDVETAVTYLTGATNFADDPKERKKQLENAKKTAQRYLDDIDLLIKDMDKIEGVTIDGTNINIEGWSTEELAEELGIGPEFLQLMLDTLDEDYEYTIPDIPLKAPEFSIKNLAGEKSNLISVLMGDLEYGDRSEGVRDLQNFLNSVIEDANLSPDGIFGPKTEAALETWKENVGDISTLFSNLDEALAGMNDGDVTEEDANKLVAAMEAINDALEQDVFDTSKLEKDSALGTWAEDTAKEITGVTDTMEEGAEKLATVGEKLKTALTQLPEIIKGALTTVFGGGEEGQTAPDPFAGLEASIDGANSALGILSTNIEAVAAKAIGTLGAEKAVQELKKVMVQLIRINNYQIADKTYNVSATGSVPGSAKGSDGSYAGISFVAEEGRELIYRKNSGKVEIANSMQMTVLEPGDQVIPNDETERILKRKDMTEVQGFAKGTGNKGLKKKLKEVDKALEDLAKLISYYASAGEYHEIRGELDAVQHYTEEQLAVLEKQEEQLRSAIEALTGQLTMLEDKQSKYKEGSKKWKNLQKQIDKTKESMGEYQQELIDTMTEQERMNQELEEARKEMQQNQIALENEILQAIEDREARNESMLQGRLQMEELIMQTLEENLEREKDIADESADARIRALQEEIDKIDELMEARRKMHDDEDKQKELAGLEAQLARISADPTRAKERLELEKKIAELRKEIAWDIAEEEAEAQKKALEEQIRNIEEYKEETDDDDIDRSELIAQMEEIMKGTDEDIIAWQMEHNEEYANATDAAQQNLINTWEDTLDQMNGVVETHWDEVESIISQGEDAIIQFLKDNSSEYREASETQAQAYVDGWRETIKNSGLFDDSGNLKPPSSDTSPTVPITESDPALNPNTRVYGFKYKVKGKWYEAERASTKEEAFAIAKEAALAAWEQYKGSTGNSARKKINKATAEKPGSFFKAYSEGGLIDYTGLAMVHGSPSMPESVLSAEDTKMFRNFVNIMKNATKIDIPAWAGVGFNADGSMMGNIQIGDIILNVDKLEDDADFEELARRVGDAIMNGAMRVNVPSWT